MNKYHAIANDAYGYDAVAQTIVSGDEVGDTLALFVGRELDDCKNIDDAVRRIETAIDDLMRVLEALVESSMDQEI